MLEMAHKAMARPHGRSYSSPVSNWPPTALRSVGYADRDKYIADTDFVPLPGGNWDARLAKPYLRGRAGLISFSKSMGTAQPGDFGTPAQALNRPLRALLCSELLSWLALIQAPRALRFAANTGFAIIRLVQTSQTNPWRLSVAPMLDWSYARKKRVVEPTF